MTGDRQVPTRAEMPVFGFIHENVVHFVIPEQHKVMLFEDPRDALYNPSIESKF